MSHPHHEPAPAVEASSLKLELDGTELPGDVQTAAFTLEVAR